MGRLNEIIIRKEAVLEELEAWIATNDKERDAERDFIKISQMLDRVEKEASEQMTQA